MTKWRGTLWVAISHHGYGHLGQMAPILGRLMATGGGPRVVIQSGHSWDVLERFLPFDFVHEPIAADQPLIMENAIRLDLPATVAALDHYHARATDEIAQLTALMQAHDVAVVLSNVGYLPLVAAHRLQIPAFAFCSLNWADILSAYLPVAPALAPHINLISECYAVADVFLAPRPAMPMPCMRNIISVGPVARGGTRHSLSALLQRPASVRFGLVSLGGIHYPLGQEGWPAVQGWEWIVPALPLPRAGFIDMRTIPLAFPDLLNSVDVLITKPGYGNVAEAGCGGIPVACLPRPDWPETPALLEWLQAQVPVLMIDESDLQSGQGLLSIAQWRKTLGPLSGPVNASGVQEMVNYVVAQLVEP